jgi:hypothetical protein
MATSTQKSPAKKSAAKKSAKPATKKVAKKVAKPATKKVAKKSNGNGSNKTQQVLALMRRAKGVTREEVLKLTGWKAVSMQQLAKSTGVTLKVDDSERPFHYMAK